MHVYDQWLSLSGSIAHTGNLEFSKFLYNI